MWRKLCISLAVSALFLFVMAAPVLRSGFSAAANTPLLRLQRGVAAALATAALTGAFAAATLSNRNLDSIPMSNKVRIPLKAGNLVLATLDAWARVKGRNHFLSDVLVGAALGHFLSAFIHDAFMGLPEQGGFAISVAPVRGGAMGFLSFCY